LTQTSELYWSVPKFFASFVVRSPKLEYEGLVHSCS